MSMIQEDFVKAVRNMRTWQKAYFRYKQPAAMQEAKKWEKEVDRMLAEEDEPNLL